MSNFLSDPKIAPPPSYSPKPKHKGSGKYYEWSFERDSTDELYEAMKDLLANAEETARTEINNAYEANMKLQDDFTTFQSETMSAVASKGALVRRGSSNDTVDTQGMRDDIGENIDTVEEGMGLIKDASAKVNADDESFRTLNDYLSDNKEVAALDNDLEGGQMATDADVDDLLSTIVDYDAGFAGIGSNIAAAGEATQGAQIKNAANVAAFYDTLASGDFKSDYIMQQLDRIDELGDATRRQRNIDKAKTAWEVTATIAGIILAVAL